MKLITKTALILCSYGFFREFRPSEPYISEFLSGEWRNVTSEQVNKILYPTATYSMLVQIVILFLVTDLLRYMQISFENV